MNETKNLTDWLIEKKLTAEDSATASGLDSKIVQAMIAGRYTPSPQQRMRVAEVFQILPSAIRWGHMTEVDHMYGHGPQFGRSP